MNVNDKRIGLRSTEHESGIGLMAVHVSGRLNGPVGQIKLRQVYKNWSDRNIECVYAFPLAWQSVLLGMKVELNGKSLAGVVKPKKTAEAEYERAIDEGDLPVMLERAGKDLYTANIGNIQPGDEVVIELDYAQLLKFEDGAVRLSLPTTIAPRYGDPADAGLRLHQEFVADPQVEQRLFLNLTLSESLSTGTVSSPTHNIRQSRHAGQLTIQLEGATWLDRDFVLIMDRVGDMRFAIAAPDPVQHGEATVLAGGMAPAMATPSHHPCAIKVLVDCSGSMQGDSIEQARDCLDWLFGHLSNNDMVSFTRFGSTVASDLPTLQPCSHDYRDTLKYAARKLNADLGGTEIDAALQSVISQGSGASESNRHAVILLITDGEVWNIENSIATVRASGHRIFAVGVGSSPAESLLQDMAEVTGGACEMVTPRESMQKAVERLVMRLRKSQAIEQTLTCSAPVLWQSNAAQHAVAGEVVTAWAQIQASSTAQGELLVGLKNQTQDTPITCPVVWDHEIELSRIAAALRLRDMEQPKDRETLALEYQLVTSETNLILIHERTEADKAEDLPELHQVRPMLAAGWGGHGTVVHDVHQPFRVMRTGCDNAPFPIMESRASTPSVWRSARTQASARTDGMNDLEIPAFLRKAEEPIRSRPQKLVQKILDLMRHSRHAPAAPSHAQTSPSSPAELVEILKHLDQAHNPVAALIQDFNQATLAHHQFNSALTACLRLHQTSYLQWLVNKHMQSAGSVTAAWAVFIIWVAEKFGMPLDRHAKRMLRDFLKSVPLDIQDAVRADLDGLLQEHDILDQTDC